MKKGTLITVTGVISTLAALFIGFGFAMLGPVFGYPDIIREGTTALLEKIHETRHITPYLYYCIGIGGVFIIYSSFLIKRVVDLKEEKNIFAELGMISGILCGAILFVGILRYLMLFPHLAQLSLADTANKETINLLFEAFNLYIGNTVTEHCMFMFLALMLFFFSIAIFQTNFVAKWIGIYGIIVGLMLFYGNMEPFHLPLSFQANRLAGDLAGAYFLLIGLDLLIMKKRRYYHPASQ